LIEIYESIKSGEYYCMLRRPQRGAANPLLAFTPWWRRRGTIIGFIVVVLIIILGAIFVPSINRRPPVTYQTQPVTQKDLSLTISATGPVQSSVYNLTFSGTGATSARIQEIDVKVGQTVKQGQQLAVVDKKVLQNAYNQQLAVVLAAENNLASNQNSLGATQNVGNANLAAAQTALANDQKALQRAREVAQATLDLDQTTLDNDQSALDQVQQQVSAADAAARAKNQVDRDNCNDPTKTLPSNVTDCLNLADTQLEQTLQTDQQTLEKAQATVRADQQKLDTDRASGDANIQTAQSRVNADQAAINTTLAQAGASNATSQNSVTSQQGMLNQALTQLAAAKRDLDNATLLAPHDGIVTIINGNVGGLPGVPTNGSGVPTSGSGTGATTAFSTFIQLVDPQALQVQANVNETDTANLQIGEPVTFTVNAFPGRTFTGTVSAISPNGQTVSNVVTYPVTIDVNPDSLNGARLLSNMTANVTIAVIQHKGVLLVPVDAVNFARLAATGNATTGQQALVDRQVVTNAMNQARQMLAVLESKNPDIVTESPIPTFVLERNKDQFVVKPVVLGLTDGTQYEVLDGLSTRDIVVTGTGNRAGQL
jgi:HlyD family secretion protein